MSTIVSASALTASTASTTTATNSSDSLSQLGTDDFLTLLLTELQYQDPTDPMDTSQMISQFSNLSQVAQAEETNDYLEAISQYASSMNNSQAVGFIGKTIAYSSDEITVSDGASNCVNYTLASEADDVSVTIYNKDGETVDTIDLGSMSAGTYSFTWDCTDKSGSTMEDATYSFKFSASDESGNDVSVSASTEQTATVTGVVYRNGTPCLVTEQGEIPVGSVTEVT